MSARIGILGAGQAGGRQAHGFALQPGARIVGVADLDPARAQALAARHHATATTSLETLLDLGLDVLVVATPHALHLEPARAAAALGVHVMMEKPIATTLADADAILDLCGSAGVRLATSFVHRHRQESRVAFDWLAAGGEVRMARETINSQITAHHPGWLGSRALAGGGVLMYTAIHGIDRLRWLLRDEVVSVSAATIPFAATDEVEGGVSAVLRFAGGAIASLSASSPRYRPEPTLWETEVFTDRSMVRLQTRLFAERSSDAGQERYLCAEDPETTDIYYNFARQAAAFLEAIAHGGDPTADGEDGLRALEICLAIYRSAAEGRTVTIAEMRAPAQEP
jgi:UDP-N-acetyl-2-amino-2-deoxyglucuronate dehydrogenase